MNDLSPKDRLIAVLRKQSVDRKPVICPGGMMNAAVVDVMEKTGHTLPAAHSEEQLMRDLSFDIQQQTGFENLGIPFCMTVEAEVMGSAIDFGSLSCEPKIGKEAFSSVTLVTFDEIPHLLKKGRVETILGAAYALHRLHGDIPVIGSLTGPISTAASIVDPMVFLKELRKDRTQAHKVLAYVTNFLIGYAEGLMESGVDVISIGDPTATGEILGPKMFEEYALPYLNRIADAVHAAEKQVIIHICGDIRPVWKYIPLLHASAISTDAMVNLSQLKRDFPALVTMGNLSTYALEFSDAEGIRKRAQALVRGDIDILAPACGLSTSSSTENLQAFTDTVKFNGDT
jgi:[methyl-Co(III) methanol-specific corrinoid protein]:coenzyme M methyltransferase